MAVFARVDNARFRCLARGAQCKRDVAAINASAVALVQTVAEQVRAAVPPCCHGRKGATRLFHARTAVPTRACPP